MLGFSARSPGRGGGGLWELLDGAGAQGEGCPVAPQNGDGIARQYCCRRIGTGRGKQPCPEILGSDGGRKKQLSVGSRRGAPRSGDRQGAGKERRVGVPGKRPAAAVRKEGGAKSGGEPRGPARAPASRPNVLSPVLRPRPPASTGAAAGRDSKMKLWDVVAVCLVLLHTASAFPLPAGKRPPEAPAEDRSLGRRRAPFALSSDCKNRSLPARVTPPAARTHPQVSPGRRVASQGRAAQAPKPPPGAPPPTGAPRLQHLVCVWHALALPNTEGNTLFCCSFRFRSTAVFPTTTTTTGKHTVVLFSLPPHHTHTLSLSLTHSLTHSLTPMFCSKALYLCLGVPGCAELRTIAFPS